MAMWAEERQQRILRVLKHSGRIEADALAAQLDVSRETVRRDLLRLEGEGRIRRIHGGAVALTPLIELPFRARSIAQIEEKRRIAHSAIHLIGPGQSCFVDAGTTTTAFALELARIPNIVVITNGLDIATTLRGGSAEVEVILLGGFLGTEVPATFGELTIEQIARFRVDLAFVSPVAIHPRQGVTYFQVREAEVARTMFAHASTRIILADHTKLGEASRVVACSCRQVDALVTDAEDAEATFCDAGIGQILLARDP
jgi:DeoR/GlpR family transcriptional regulator of sugar metabolism